MVQTPATTSEPSGPGDPASGVGVGVAVRDNSPRYPSLRSRRAATAGGIPHVSLCRSLALGSPSLLSYRSAPFVSLCVRSRHSPLTLVSFSRRSYRPGTLSCPVTPFMCPP